MIAFHASGPTQESSTARVQGFDPNSVCPGLTPSWCFSSQTKFMNQQMFQRARVLDVQYMCDALGVLPFLSGHFLIIPLQAVGIFFSHRHHNSTFDEICSSVDNSVTCRKLSSVICWPEPNSGVNRTPAYAIWRVPDAWVLICPPPKIHKNPTPHNKWMLAGWSVLLLTLNEKTENGCFKNYRASFPEKELFRLTKTYLVPKVFSFSCQCMGLVVLECSPN